MGGGDRAGGREREEEIKKGRDGERDGRRQRQRAGEGERERKKGKRSVKGATDLQIQLHTVRCEHRMS